MRYRTLLLDLDHTLFDSDTCELQAFEETLRAVGVEEPLQQHETTKPQILPCYQKTLL